LDGNKNGSGNGNAGVFPYFITLNTMLYIFILIEGKSENFKIF